MKINQLELTSQIITINRDIYRAKKDVTENAGLNPAATVYIANLTKVLERLNAELARPDVPNT